MKGGKEDEWMLDLMRRLGIALIMGLFIGLLFLGGLKTEEPGEISPPSTFKYYK